VWWGGRGVVRVRLVVHEERQVQALPAIAAVIADLAMSSEHREDRADPSIVEALGIEAPMRPRQGAERLIINGISGRRSLFVDQEAALKKLCPCQPAVRRELGVRPEDLV